MQVVKFVTEDFKSPGNYGQLDYSKFGIPIEVEADPKEKGQCARGIHVVPISEDVDFEKVIFTGTMILLEVAEEDIVYCEDNRKMRVRKAVPVRQLKKSDKEWRIIRKAACKEPKYAYEYAKDVDKKPTNGTKTVACKEPKYAYFYALDVDQKPTDETKTVACKSPGYAYLYALNIDKKPTDETRTVACQQPDFAYFYALDVDKNPTNATRTGACKYPYYAYKYAIYIDNCSTKETRTAAHKDSHYAYLYDAFVIRDSIYNYMKKMINKLFMKTKSL
jgi:hypothetical protein